MKKLSELNYLELHELKSVIRGIIDDYDFQLEMYQKLNNLNSFERQAQDKNFIALCEKRKKFQNYSNSIGQRIESEIHQLFNTNEVD